MTIFCGRVSCLTITPRSTRAIVTLMHQEWVEIVLNLPNPAYKACLEKGLLPLNRNIAVRGVLAVKAVAKETEALQGTPIWKQ